MDLFSGCIQRDFVFIFVCVFVCLLACFFLLLFTVHLFMYDYHLLTDFSLFTFLSQGLERGDR